MATLLLFYHDAVIITNMFNSFFSCANRDWFNVPIFIKYQINLQDRLLDEQQSILSQLHEERRALAEERAKFEVSQRLATEQTHRENAKSVRAEVEVESTVRALNEEKSRLIELRYMSGHYLLTCKIGLYQ